MESAISNAEASSPWSSIHTIGMNSSATTTQSQDNRLTIGIHVLILVLIMLAVFVLMAFLSQYLTHHGMQDLSMYDILTRLCLARRAAHEDLEEGTHTHTQLSYSHTQIVESLPTLAFSSTTLPLFLTGSKKKLHLQSECVICLEHFRDGETLKLLPACAHLFHMECIKIWLLAHITCPLCRHSLLPIDTDTDTNPDADADIDIVYDSQASSSASFPQPLAHHPLPAQMEMQHVNVDISPDSYVSLRQFEEEG